MADSSLPVTGSSGGGQTPSTQNNLQAGGQTLDNGLTGKVQTGIAADQLKSSQGISLSPQALPTVSLGTATATIPAAAPPQKHLNPVLLVFTVLLVAVAAALFVAISKSGKKYNQYR